MYAVAIGYDSWASGTSSFAAGFSNLASGDYSFAFGNLSKATGDYTVASGWNAEANGSAAVSLGYFTTANGTTSFATGSNTTALGETSMALGGFTKSTGNYSMATGLYTNNRSFAGTVIGLFNDTVHSSSLTTINSQNRIFEIGNGISTNARSNAMTVLQNGNIGIGELSPLSRLHLSGSGAANQIIVEDATNNKILRISNDGGGTGPYIGTSTNDPFTLVTNNAVRAIITNTGTVDVKNNLTVQNGRGIIRNTDGTQSKKLSTAVTINASFTAGQTQTFSVTWPESFSGTPEAFVGNVTSGTGGWAEVVMTLFNTTTTGATLYVYNPRTVTVNPNFTIRIIAIGPQ
jgi:Head domain of trimeric autotransporter adhesin